VYAKSPTPDDKDAETLKRLGREYGVYPVERVGSTWSKTAQIGMEFIAAVMVCVAIGWWLDGQLGTSPWLVIGGTGLGFAAGLWLMVKASKRSFKDSK
jgi:F0F1-type ATP synthase assembly protein I